MMVAQLRVVVAGSKEVGPVHIGQPGQLLRVRLPPTQHEPGDFPMFCRTPGQEMRVPFIVMRPETETRGSQIAKYLKCILY